MSKPGKEWRPADAVRARIGLIAGEGTRELIAEIVAREELTLTSFDSVQAILDIDGSADPSAIVLCGENGTFPASSLVESLRKRFEETPVVLACAGVQRWEVRAALAAGAAGVVVYDELKTCLGPCLRAVRAGQICVPRGHWREVEAPVLSTREKQVLGLVALGCMNRQIAERLFLAESTVKGHLSSAFGKLGVRSRSEAADLIMNPERGLGRGILALGGEPGETVPATAR
ncbi:MAG TPA: helix-turn-helix transcriptional regulator [Solirubrobacteraceae bacterium]|jgi:DNA-binding NarL/FixJ family response regulator|nr:helix-turn-helix transcriptional regulator [Solirubrobacteraceae bacterium]